MILIWTLVFLTLGVGWRSFRYFSQFPVWGDEAFIALNFVDQTYAGLLQPTKYHQVAPILFLWGELAVYQLFGSSELAVRLLPFLAGLGSLFLFWRLSRQLLPGWAGLVALAIFAVSYYPTRHACEIKHYSFDVLMPLLLLTLAVEWLKQPRRILALLGLCLAVVPAMGFSFSAVFVAGGVSLAMLPALLRIGTWKSWTLWFVYNGLLVGGFLVFLQISLGMKTPETMGHLDRWWGPAFPPFDPLGFAKWFVLIHTGNMMAYPIGGQNGASALNFILLVIGAFTVWRMRRAAAFLLLLAPFALTFVAAAMHRYPYGYSARVSQHLAPAICLLMAVGITALIARWRHSERREKYIVAAVCGLMLLIGAAGFIRDVVQPFKTPADIMGRQNVQIITSQTNAQTPIVLLDGRKTVQPEFLWYLHRYHPAVYFSSDVDWADLSKANDEIVVLRFVFGHKTPEDTPDVPLGKQSRSWILSGKEVYSRPLDPRSFGCDEYCQVLRYEARHKD